jgi:hypothetical protein
MGVPWYRWLRRYPGCGLLLVSQLFLPEPTLVHVLTSF